MSLGFWSPEEQPWQLRLRLRFVIAGAHGKLILQHSDTVEPDISARTGSNFVLLGWWRGLAMTIPSVQTFWIRSQTSDFLYAQVRVIIADSERAKHTLRQLSPPPPPRPSRPVAPSSRATLPPRAYTCVCAVMFFSEAGVA